VTPGVRSRALERDGEIGSATTEVDLAYVAPEVGLALRFWEWSRTASQGAGGGV
jgi:hypothetical protein